MTFVETPACSAISSPSRVRLLAALFERGDRPIDELCAATALHPNTVREHLNRLIDGGYVTVRTEPRATRGRPRVLYSATGAGRTSEVAKRKATDAAARGDLMRRVLPGLGSTLPTEAVHQLDALVDDLAGAGFDPAVDEGSLTVDLTPCLHADDDPADRAQLCAVHLGLMNGVLSTAGGPLTVAGLAPTCDPAECVVRLASR
jgi:predicted ArsR family transcriptional regulator